MAIFTSISTTALEYIDGDGVSQFVIVTSIMSEDGQVLIQHGQGAEWKENRSAGRLYGPADQAGICAVCNMAIWKTEDWWINKDEGTLQHQYHDHEEDEG